ncbi:MAG: IclR family transcriptional regulator [Rhodovibrionaceae bacterium]
MAKKASSENEESTKPVAAVERAISILDAFEHARPTLTLAELSDRTGLYKSTILRLIQSFLNNGYLVRNSRGEFHVGPKPLMLANRFQSAVQPEDIVLPILQGLVDKTEESASYSVRQDNLRICVYRINSPKMLRDHGRPGDVAPLEKGAVGRIFLAFSDSPSGKLSDVRKRLFAVTYGELEAGMIGLASPVFDSDGEVIGALALTGPATRFDKKTVAKMEKELVQAAYTLTGRLGGDRSRFEGVLGIRH